MVLCLTNNMSTHILPGQFLRRLINYTETVTFKLLKLKKGTLLLSCTGKGVSIYEQLLKVTLQEKNVASCYVPPQGKDFPTFLSPTSALVEGTGSPT